MGRNCACCCARVKLWSLDCILLVQSDFENFEALWNHCFDALTLHWCINTPNKPENGLRIPFYSILPFGCRSDSGKTLQLWSFLARDPKSQNSISSHGIKLCPSGLSRYTKYSAKQSFLSSQTCSKVDFSMNQYWVFYTLYCPYERL